MVLARSVSVIVHFHVKDNMQSAMHLLVGSEQASNNDRGQELIGASCQLSGDLMNFSRASVRQLCDSGYPAAEVSILQNWNLHSPVLSAPCVSFSICLQNLSSKLVT